MIRQWSVRLGTASLCVLVLTACTGEALPPQPSGPLVTTGEFEQRLAAHLSRFVTEVLEPDAHAGTPTYSRVVGCAGAPGGGPTWGVVPRAEMTLSAGEKATKYVEDLATWVSRNNFADVTDTSASASPGASPTDIRRVSAVSEDGTRLDMQLPPNSPPVTIALTGPCTWPPDRPGGPPPSGQLPPLQPPSEPTQTFDTNSDEHACRSPKLYVYNRAAPPFAGPGPHLMNLVNYRDQQSIGYVSLPDSWEGQEGEDLNQVPYRVQLLVCVQINATRDSGRDVTCFYSFTSVPSVGGTPHTFDMFESTYQVTVLEASSGKRISEFTVPGTQGDQESCPETLGGDPERTLARGIDEAALHGKLRPLLTTSR